jgi:hypothetical protein
LSPGGKEVFPEDTRGADATLRLVGVRLVREAGVKAAPPLRPEAMRRAALLIDNFILDIDFSLYAIPCCYCVLRSRCNDLVV